MKKPTKEQLDKLPIWVKEYIRSLERERDVSIRSLNEFKDSQTPSGFYYDDVVCTGEECGSSFKRRYIQTDKMIVQFEGVELQIYCRPMNGIELQYGGLGRTNIDIAMIPRSYQFISLQAKDGMRQ